MIGGWGDLRPQFRERGSRLQSRTHSWEEILGIVPILYADGETEAHRISPESYREPDPQRLSSVPTQAPLQRVSLAKQNFILPQSAG